MAEFGEFFAARSQRQRSTTKREVPTSREQTGRPQETTRSAPAPDKSAPVDPVAEKAEKLRRFKEELDRNFDKGADKDRGRAR
jgi:hypothetical protein